MVFFNRRKSAGFTLLELMVVIAIIGLLIGLVGPRVMGMFDKAKTDTARIQISNLANAANMYKLDVGRAPTSAEGLQALVTRPGSAPGWRGPYLQEGVPNDPWGQPYHYESPGRHSEFDIYTYGADNAPGGEGDKTDVGNWK